MKQRHIIAIFCTAVGFMVGALITYAFIKPDKWLDAKFILTLFTGAGYVVGHFLGKKSEGTGSDRR